MQGTEVDTPCKPGMAQRPANNSILAWVHCRQDVKSPRESGSQAWRVPVPLAALEHTLQAKNQQVQKPPAFL